MKKISDDMMVAIPEHIPLHDPPVHYDAIRAALQAAWFACWAVYGFLRDQIAIENLKPFDQLFPHGKSASLAHVGDMIEVERRVNGIMNIADAPARTGEIMGFKILAIAYNKAIDSPDMISEAENIIVESQDRIVSIWDLLNQAAYRAQDMAGKISPVFHQLEFDAVKPAPAPPGPPPPFPPAPDAE